MEEPGPALLCSAPNRSMIHGFSAVAAHSGELGETIGTVKYGGRGGEMEEGNTPSISREQMVNMCLCFIHKHQTQGRTALASWLALFHRKDTERPPSLSGMVGYIGLRMWSLPGLLLLPPF
ncbi:hypothetical protein SRHO_G00054330 [Serrasalmus rhombeus]